MEKIRLFGILHIIGNIIRKEIKMDVINEYEQVLIGNLPKIPPRLFQNEPSANEHLALSVFRYAIEKLLRWTPMEAYRLFSPAVMAPSTAASSSTAPSRSWTRTCLLYKVCCRF